MLPLISSKNFKFTHKNTKYVIERFVCWPLDCCAKVIMRSSLMRCVDNNLLLHLKKTFLCTLKKRFFAPSTKRIFKRNESLFHLNEIIWLMHNTFDQIFDLPTINLKIRQFYYGCISDPFIINFRFKMNQISQVYSHVSYRSTDSIKFSHLSFVNKFHIYFLFRYVSEYFLLFL